MKLKALFNNKVYKNASWIVIGKIVQSALGFVVSLLTARYLGPSNYGVINYAMSIASFVLPIVELGISNVLVQEIVNNTADEGEILGTSITLSFFSAIICIWGLNVFINLANRGETETIVVCSLYSTILIFQALELIRYWYQAKYLAKYSSIISLIAYLLVSGYKIFLLATGKNVYWFAISYTFDYLLITIFSFIVYKKLKGKKFKFSLATAKRLLGKGKYYIISSLMITIFSQTDKIMIKFMMDDASVGFYSVAVSLANITNFLFAAIIDSFRPTIFESFNESNEKFELNIKRLYSIIIYLSLLQSVLMTAFAYIGIKLLYGEEYLESVNALRVVVWYCTFSYAGSVRNIWILSKNKQKYLWIINLSGAVANIVLNFILIPYLGIVGAAIASFVTEFFTNFIIGYIIRPISESNKLMLQSLNPKYIFGIFKE